MNRRTLYWILPILLLLTMPALLPVVHAKGKSAKALYKAGQAAEARDDYIAAYEAYAGAFQKEPGNLYYKTSYERLKFNAAAVHTHRGEKLRDQGDMSGALTEFVRAPMNWRSRTSARPSRSSPPPLSMNLPKHRRARLHWPMWPRPRS
jgi:general secretion pathway protein D